MITNSEYGCPCCKRRPKIKKITHYLLHITIKRRKAPNRTLYQCGMKRPYILYLQSCKKPGSSKALIVEIIDNPDNLEKCKFRSKTYLIKTA